jgi:5-methylcytosine-specific restriction endonuclease McrA
VRCSAVTLAPCPVDVRRAVWARDGGRCKFEGAAGRCSETGRLEFHHVVPYAEGGATSVENLALRCAAHNRYEAEEWFGMLVREDSVRYGVNEGRKLN